MKYEKVGRMKPDGNCVRIFMDDLGEVGSITREDIEELLTGCEPEPVVPSGEVDLSESQRGVRITIPVGGQVYIAVAGQVATMLNKWPRKKAAVFRVEE